MKLSIIVPVYNVENYLGECLDSLLGQSFSDWEAICVDDGSTDGSGRMLDEYTKRDSRIRVVHQTNAKVHAARNRALNEARGEWIGFLDPDDVISRRWFEVAVAQMKEGIDFVHLTSEYHGASVSREFGGVDHYQESARTFTDTGSFAWCWTELPSNGFLWLCFIRAARIGSLRFRPDINCKEDGVFLLELAPSLRGITQVDFPGYFYRTVPGSLSIRRHYVMQTVAFINAYREVWMQQREIADSRGLADRLRCALTHGVVADITDWALKHRGDDPHGVGLVWVAYQKFVQSGARDCSYSCVRRRYRLPFWIWERTGLVFPMTIVGRFCLTLGNLMRGVNGRRQV